MPHFFAVWLWKAGSPRGLSEKNTLLHFPVLHSVCGCGKLSVIRKFYHEVRTVSMTVTANIGSPVSAGTFLLSGQAIFLLAAGNIR